MSGKDCQNENPVMILVERLREASTIVPATGRPRAPYEYENSPCWQAAEALLSLSQERDRLREGITGTIELIRAWASDEGFPVESSACFQRLSAALHKDQSQ